MKTVTKALHNITSDGKEEYCIWFEKGEFLKFIPMKPKFSWSGTGEMPKQVKIEFIEVVKFPYPQSTTSGQTLTAHDSGEMTLDICSDRLAELVQKWLSISDAGEIGITEFLSPVQIARMRVECQG